MSINLYVQRLPAERAEALRRNPSGARDIALVAADDLSRASLEALFSGMPAEQQAEARAQHEQVMQSFRQSELAQAALAMVDAARDRVRRLPPLAPALALEKSWHVIHFALTGTAGASASPGDLMFAGATIGDDTGYGPASLVTPQAVSAFHAHLTARDDAALIAGLDLNAMARAHVYGSSNDEGAREMHAEELAFYLPRLRAYAAAAAAAGEAALVWRA